MNKEEVKTALRCCIVRDPDDKMRCTECPYRFPLDSYCLNRLKMDALALLYTLTSPGCGPDYCEIGDNANV